MPWRKTADGSIEDEAGKVVFFSTARFINDICLGRCCFVCGAQPGSKIFNDEHVIPEWVLRKFGLFHKSITLPNNMTIKYDRFKVSCCQDCNSLMGRQIEERISKVVNAGPEAIQKHIADGGALEFFVWLGLIFLKTHIKDREFRIHRDLRKPDDRIGDLYNWKELHHLHCITRCFMNGAVIEKEVFGSLGAFPAKTEGSLDEFDYSDIVAAQTVLLRLGEVVLVATFNDACGALQGVMPIIERIDGPLSEIQAREVLVDFAFMNLSLVERPRFHTEIDLSREMLTEKATIPERFELGELDYRLRGRLLRLSFGSYLKQFQVAGKTQQEVQQAIDDGRFSVLFDDSGKFIKQGFTPFSTSSP